MEREENKTEKIILKVDKDSVVCMDDLKEDINVVIEHHKRIKKFQEFKHSVRKSGRRVL